MNGFVHLHRKIRGHWIWGDPLYLRSWIDLLMMAEFREAKRLVGKRLHTVPRGSVIASERFLAKRWKVSRGSVIHLLSLLEADSMISRDPETSQITILNYETYAGIPSDSDPAEIQPRSTRDPAAIHARSKSNNINNSKEPNNTPLPPKGDVFELPPSHDLPEVRAALEAWFAYKRERRQAYKPRGVTALVAKVAREYINPAELVLAIENSMANNYQGIFRAGSPNRTRSSADEFDREFCKAFGITENAPLDVTNS